LKIEILYRPPPQCDMLGAEIIRDPCRLGRQVNEIAS